MATETVSPKVAQYVEKLNGSLSRIKAKAIEQKENAIEITMAAGGAYGGAYVNARYPERKIAGADIDAVAAVLCGVGAVFTHGTSALVLGGLATGLACSVTARMGAAKGNNDRAAALAAGAK